MKKRLMLFTSFAVLMILGAAAVLWAAVPPPPVNQFLGIYDTKFTFLTKNDCFECHVSDAVLVTRHHNLINSTTPPVSCIRQAGQPASLANGCHVLIPDGSGGFTFQDFRDCFTCHSTSPHHTTAAALARHCNVCHGSFVDNFDDNHTIPTYAPSSVTPGPVGRSVVNPQGQVVVVNGCAACHQPDPTAIDPRTNTVRPIFSNQDLHHGTGLTNCGWCHDFNAPAQIRQCETCHGMKSLHNIQKDSDAPANLGTIVPGAENLGWGHIGNNWDCQGCHWSWFGNAAGPTTATVPAINGQSAYTLAGGKETVLTLTGASFTNIGGDGSTIYNPTVKVSNGTTSLTLQPFSVTVSEIKVTVPALSQGSYDLRVVKDTVQSNLAKLNVVPPVSISSVVLGAGNTVTIVGTAFGSAPPVDYKSGLGVFAGTTQAKVAFWSDSKIVATSPAFTAGTAVTVKTLFGPISGNIAAAGKKTKR